MATKSSTKVARDGHDASGTATVSRFCFRPAESTSTGEGLGGQVGERLPVRGALAVGRLLAVRSALAVGRLLAEARALAVGVMLAEARVR